MLTHLNIRQEVVSAIAPNLLNVTPRERALSAVKKWKDSTLLVDSGHTELFTDPSKPDRIDNPNLTPRPSMQVEVAASTTPTRQEITPSLPSEPSPAQHQPAIQSQPPSQSLNVGQADAAATSLVVNVPVTIAPPLSSLPQSTPETTPPVTVQTTTDAQSPQSPLQPTSSVKEDPLTEEILQQRGMFDQ